MTRKTFFDTIFPIIMLALMIFVIKSITTEENKEFSEDAIDMIENPVAYLTSAVHDLFSVYSPEYGSRERKVKMVKRYQEDKINNISQPLEMLKENNDTQGYDLLRARYVKELFKLVKTPYAKVLDVKAYLRSGININTQDKKGRTILYYATAMKNGYLVRYLLKEGADTEIRDYINLRPVDLLDKQNDKNLYLSFHQRDVENSASKDGLSSVHVNYTYDEHNNITSTKVVGEKKSTWSPLMLAIQEHSTQKALHYINNGQYINAQTNNGSTALFIAIKYREDEVLDALLSHGCNIQHRNRFKMNPLALAIKTNNLYAVRKLVQKGVDTQSVCVSQRTPLQYAQSNQRKEIEKYLISIGAH